MSTRRKIVEAIRALAEIRAPEELTFADVARLAGVHWTTVRRHVGSREALRKLAAESRPPQGMEHLDTRARLLLAAARLTAKKGFQTTSLDEVAAEAGLTKGAIYWHFASKHDLLLELMHQTIRQQMQGRPSEVSAIMAADDPVQALAAWLEKELPDQDSPAAIAALFVECSVHPDSRVREKLREIVREVIQETTEFVQALQARGEITGLDPRIVSVYLQAVLNGLMLNWLIDPERVRPALWSHEFAELILYGLQPGGRK